MAKTVLTNVQLLVNGTDLSAQLRSVTTTDERSEVDVTAMGASNTQTAKGLGDAAIEVELYQDFSPGSTHATLAPLVSTSTPFAVEVRPVNGARSATNPAMYLASASMFGYQGLDGSVNDASVVKATFKNSSVGAGITYPTS